MKLNEPIPALEKFRVSNAGKLLRKVTRNGYRIMLWPVVILCLLPVMLLLAFEVEGFWLVFGFVFFMFLFLLLSILIMSVNDDYLGLGTKQADAKPLSEKEKEAIKQSLRKHIDGQTS